MAAAPAWAQLARNADLWRMEQVQNPGDLPPGATTGGSWPPSSTIAGVPIANHARLPMVPNQAIWVKFSAPPDAANERYFLQVAAVHFWRASLYRRLPSGQWEQEEAGVSIARAKWPFPKGIPPAFNLLTSPTEPSEYWLRLVHDRVIEPELHIRTEREMIPVVWNNVARAGALFGMFLLLTLFATFQAAIHKSSQFASVAAYTAISAIAAACATGHATLLLWPNSPDLAYAMRAAFPIFSLAALALFVWYTTPSTRTLQTPKWMLLAIATIWTAFAVFAGASAHTVPPGMSTAMIASAIVAIVLMCIRLGSTHNRWPWFIALSLFPVAALVPSYLAGYFESTQWLSLKVLGFHTSEVIAWALLIHNCVLSIALIARLRGLWAIEARADTTGDADPLTGLMLPELVLQRRWPAQLKRAHFAKVPSAAVLVEWLNWADVTRQTNAMTAQRLTLAAAAALTRISRDIDTVCMPNPSSFLILMETPVSKQETQDFCLRVVTEGLKIGGNGALKQPLQFAVIAAISGSSNLSGDELLRTLKDELQKVAESSKRRVRVVELP